MLYAVPIGVEIKFTRPPEMAVRQFYKARQDAWQTAGHFWHDDILPRHFTQRAKDLYGNKKRSERYLKRKERRKKKYGGNVDNVYTGAMEEAVKKTVYIRASAINANLRMVGPRYMNMKNFRQPDKVAEITKVLSGEANEVKVVYAKDVYERLENSTPTTTTVKI
jgi:hypothetical protein